jgi:hypothetical protein
MKCNRSGVSHHCAYWHPPVSRFFFFFFLNLSGTTLGSLSEAAVATAGFWRACFSLSLLAVESDFGHETTLMSGKNREGSDPTAHCAYLVGLCAHLVGVTGSASFTMAPPFLHRTPPLSMGFPP